jgi:hypothetical protein
MVTHQSQSVVPDESVRRRFIPPGSESEVMRFGFLIRSTLSEHYERACIADLSTVDV